MSTMNSWHSYPSIYNLGHRYIGDLLTVSVIVEEKIDGSQFSFGLSESGESGELLVRSKGVVMDINAPEKMFSKAVETVKELAPDLVPGWTYRVEYLQKPKHNVLAYNRVPSKNIILFDINRGEEDYVDYENKSIIAKSLGLEVVPKLYDGILPDISILTGLLDRESILGGQKIEGVVVKQKTPTLFGQDKKALIGKYVSAAFKEVHKSEWRTANPTPGDVALEIGESLKTPARWVKAVIHLRERGLIQDTPQDIGLLVKEVPADIQGEMEEEIKQRLFDQAWPKIRRIATNGLPEWYKQQLAEKQFLKDAA